MYSAAALEATNSGNVSVGWRSPGPTNASLPKSDSDVSPSQVDGTARTGHADIHAYHASDEARWHACNPENP